MGKIISEGNFPFGFVNLPSGRVQIGSVYDMSYGFSEGQILTRREFAEAIKNHHFKIFFVGKEGT